MSASKSRPRWVDLPRVARAAIEELVGGTVRTARSCPGGFSPGFASRLVLADGRRCFVKAMDTERWPGEAPLHRAEAEVNAVLPDGVPAPRLLGAHDGDGWVILAFADVDGVEPAQPWRPGELDRVVAEVTRRVREPVPAPPSLPREHPRLGGWAGLAADDTGVARLAELSPWAAERLPLLVDLEAAGLSQARGDSLVHCDLYPHNVLLTADRVVFVDWPHARAGAAVIDLITVLSSAAADGIDPEPVLRRHLPELPAAKPTVDAILAAHAGFLVRGALATLPPGLEAIAAAKLRLGRGALRWLRRRVPLAPRPPEVARRPEAPRPSRRPLEVPHPSRLAPDHPYRDRILSAHAAALAAGQAGYSDPDTGLFVLTAGYLAERGTCCGRGCRHCPYLVEDGDGMEAGTEAEAGDGDEDGVHSGDAHP